MTLLWDADPSAKERYDFAVGAILRVDTQVAAVRALGQDRLGLGIVVGGDDPERNL